MRTALCLLLVIAPVCAQPPKDEGAKAFLAFMTKFAELRKVEADAEGNEVALPKARKATADFLKALKGKEMVWPLLPVSVGPVGRGGLCPVVPSSLSPACWAVGREKALPSGWAAVAPKLGRLKLGVADVRLHVELAEAEAGGLRRERLCFVRVTIGTVTVGQGGVVLGVDVRATRAALVK